MLNRIFVVIRRHIKKCLFISLFIMLIVLQINNKDFYISRKLQEDTVSLSKRLDRPIWDLGRTSAVIGLVLTAANALYTAWCPVLCIIPTSPTCWTLVVGLTISAGVSTLGISYAAYQDYFNGEFDIMEEITPISLVILNRYRSQYKLTNTTFHTFPAVNSTSASNSLYKPDYIYDEVVHTFINAGLGTPLLTKSNYLFDKKESNTRDTYDSLTIHWSTPLGQHTATNLNHYDVRWMASDIAQQYLSGYNGSTLYTKNAQKMSMKKNEGQVVNWVSYNMNEGGPIVENLSLWKSFKNFGQWDENIEALSEMFYKNNIYKSWKWNVDIVTDAGISGTRWFDRRKKRAITHGEVYLNQYGGLEKP
ncbi:hypothetical protein TBLA_0D04980 [Henningerozyma blattae CBS 6284]|uniref:Uncharacterized protein n=1 Tax=Henningerozyma blattae (strain ATCC 34711 / CBS 6284 / DSM 70876 / NBRC 10599 / NRRL Y-10934 / UCD 77-7) TaxID=1071380 RepID=I2H3P0_HENB6|nr:hypothetical protein TBLA_0D04980 [Tetrapisispora blattae CBS 6284]CCH60992.1 hypothetical protein TBLA_0D04980 [Tetrapisispora blattae CBS 6284]